MKYLNNYNTFNEGFDIDTILDGTDDYVELNPIIDKLNDLFYDLGLLIKFKKQQFIKQASGSAAAVFGGKGEKVYNFYCCLISLDFPEIRNSLLGSIFIDLYHANWVRFNYKGGSVERFKIVFTKVPYFKNRTPSNSNLEIYDYPSSKEKIIPLIIKDMLIGFENLSDDIAYPNITTSTATEHLPYIRQIIIHYLKGVIRLKGNISEEAKYKLMAESINSTDKAFLIYDLLNKNNKELFNKLGKYFKNIDMAADMGDLGFQ